jgi:hypothetical protein
MRSPAVQFTWRLRKVEILEKNTTTDLLLLRVLRYE